jgi:hypothetical protein
LAEAAPLEMVDVFRASANVAPLTDSAIALGARTIWMQLGVIDTDAAAKARSAGVAVVMDRCPVIEDRRIGPFRAPLTPVTNPQPQGGNQPPAAGGNQPLNQGMINATFRAFGPV